MAIGDPFEELFAGPLPNQSYLDRLEKASFISPSGIEFNFKFDEVSRELVKKLSVSEILDSDESISQDQGNRALLYPMSIYFSGKDYDLIADQFFNALSEKYTRENPGILNHPRWGSITVFPMSSKQSENFVSGAAVSRFDVPFLRIYQGTAPVSEEASLQDIKNVSDKLKESTEQIFDNVILERVRDVSDFAGRISNAFGIINGVVGGLVSSQEKLIDEIENIADAFNTLLDNAADNAYLLVFQTQRMMDLPGDLRDRTLTKINRFKDLYDLLIGANQNDPSNNNNVQKNSVVLLESICGYAVGQMVVSSTTTDYSTRSQVINTIELLADTYLNFNDELNNNSILNYQGDHNFLSNLADLTKQTILLLLNVAFELDAEKRIVLKEASDPISICYKYYGDIDLETTQFFVDTNYLINDEIIELPAGKEIIIYG